ncbi:MAG: TlpA disulfide reductase family protein [Caldisericia bacterium]|nr:TlpA disulfide reductase family protein [Caldisericia bacterium]
MKKDNRNLTLVWVGLLIVLFVVVIFLIVKSTSRRDNTSLNSGGLTSSETKPNDSVNPPTKPEDYVDSNVLAKLPQEFIPIGNRQEVPDFTLPDLDQKTITLSDFRGTFVLLDFTTTWCRWCETQKPSILELMEKNQDDFRVLAIDVQETEQEIRAHYPNGPEYPLVLDKDGKVTQMFGVKGFPFYLLVSPTGEVIYYQSGYVEDMTQRVNAVLEEVRKNG